MIESYPLQWPVGYQRIKYPTRSKFKGTFAASRDGIIKELKMLGAKAIVLSTNIPLKNDGMPYATFKTPDDKGVAVYFELFNEPSVLACDKWDRIEDNMKAVMLTVQAMRGIDRWGVSDILKRTFTGFKALPESCTSTNASWWEILGVSINSNEDEIKTAYRALAKKYHPDVNSINPEYFNVIQSAYEQAINN
jgi:hypothetical protein